MNIFEEPRELDFENRKLIRLRVKCERCGKQAVLLFAREYVCEECLCPDEKLSVLDYLRSSCALSYEENMESTSHGSDYTQLFIELTEAMRKRGMLDPIKQARFSRPRKRVRK